MCPPLFFWHFRHRAERMRPKRIHGCVERVRATTTVLYRQRAQLAFKNKKKNIIFFSQFDFIFHVFRFALSVFGIMIFSLGGLF